MLRCPGISEFRPDLHELVHRSPRTLHHAVLSSLCFNFDVNRFYPKTQLSWLARLDHSHCNSADPLTDGLEVCCVFYRPGPGGAMCVVWWWKVLESGGREGMHQGSRRLRGGCRVPTRAIGHMQFSVQLCVKEHAQRTRTFEYACRYPHSLRDSTARPRTGYTLHRVQWSVSARAPPRYALSPCCPLFRSTRNGME